MLGFGIGGVIFDGLTLLAFRRLGEPASRATPAAPESDDGDLSRALEPESEACLSHSAHKEASAMNMCSAFSHVIADTIRSVTSILLGLVVLFDRTPHSHKATARFSPREHTHLTICLELPLSRFFRRNENVSRGSRYRLVFVPQGSVFFSIYFETRGPLSGPRKNTRAPRERERDAKWREREICFPLFSRGCVLSFVLSDTVNGSRCDAYATLVVSSTILFGNSALVAEWCKALRDYRAARGASKLALDVGPETGDASPTTSDHGLV